LLKAFQLKESDMLVGYGQDWLLKNPSSEELATCLARIQVRWAKFAA
jgi:hypothetical protein